MTRPKVKPENRQRGALACLPCKRLKIRCNAQTPCSTCIKRGRQDDCAYQDPLERRITHGRRRRPPSDYESKQGQDAVESAESTGPQSRTLLSSKFQKLYIGETASLSYLHFMRGVVQHCISTNAFSEGEFSSFMLESDVGARMAAQAPSDGASSHLEPVFVQSYLDATSGVLDLFGNEDIFESVDDPSSSMDIACRHLILAIGAQCRGLSPSDLSYASLSFESGQKLAFADFLCDPSQDMYVQWVALTWLASFQQSLTDDCLGVVSRVRRFLLMSFYMIAACHRNAAFMYLGVAWKAACALGLHRADQYHRLSTGECVLRLRAWRSLRILDTIVNSILGRSGGTSGMQCDPRMDGLWSNISDPDRNSLRGKAVQAAFDMCPFMDELERKGPVLDPAFTENFLKRLQLWLQAVPLELRSSIDAFRDYNATGKESFVGAAHVACMYYFAIVLSTRRFFTQHVMPLVKETPGESNGPTSPAPNGKRSDLAHACLDAAKNLASVGYNATKSDKSVNNMCLVKAWVFAAGLLLGFWLFAQCDDSDAELIHAFQQSRDALQQMAAFSPQARHYFEILTALGSAIEVHRSKKVKGRERSTDQHINLDLDLDADVGLLPDTSISGARSLDDKGDGDVSNHETVADQGAILDNELQAFPGGSNDPGGMSISDDFPWPIDDFEIDWQPFAPFLNDI